MPIYCWLQPPVLRKVQQVHSAVDKFLQEEARRAEEERKRLEVSLWHVDAMGFSVLWWLLRVLLIGAQRLLLLLLIVCDVKHYESSKDCDLI